MKQFQQARSSQPESSVVLVDRSASMKNTDYSPTRLDGAKAAASVFLRRKPLVDHRDRCAVVAFNTEAVQVSQMGEHPVEAERLLRPMGPSGNTSITAGLKLALVVLKDQPQTKTVPILRCVLLSDGHHNSGLDPRAAGVLAGAVSMGVIVDAIAIGEANDAMLREIATATGGEYARCGTTEELRALYDRLAEKKVGIW